ncbi:hypothetical protein Sjap_021369 [Stephania japonica]|uniref:F-box associated beta-propeller type 3 domain-containing protein n=1 Tax=Stephania japonica TaxID=461633 RepID=A0AAP0EQ11_9MAGN
MDRGSTSQKKILMRPASSKVSNLLKLVQEREMSRKNYVKQHDHLNKDENKQQSDLLLVPNLTKDCIIEILLRLPLESLWDSRLVCKLWFKMINTSFLADAFFLKSELGFIFQMPVQEGKESDRLFCVDERLHASKSISIFCSIVKKQKKLQMHYMEIKDGECHVKELDISCFGRIIATCDGLVLVENTMKRGGLVVVNAVTKQMMGLPLGTLFSAENESYGFAYDSSIDEYKVVHLFRDEMRYIGCEVMALGAAESWKPIDGPSYGLLTWFQQAPVSAIGALHWMPHKVRSEYVVSMSITDEKFRKTQLPTMAGVYDGLVDLGGFLCFVNHDQGKHIDLWILKDLFEKNWVKQHKLTLTNPKAMVPMASSRNGNEMYFRTPLITGHEDCAVYVYDIELHQLSKVKINKNYFAAQWSYFPHINSLMSWRNHRCVRKEDNKLVS